MACKEFRETPAGPLEADTEIAGIAAYLVAAHGAEAGGIAEAVCASAEAAGNCRQAVLWRRVCGAVAMLLGPKTRHCADVKP